MHFRCALLLCRGCADRHRTHGRPFVSRLVKTYKNKQLDKHNRHIVHTIYDIRYLAHHIFIESVMLLVQILTMAEWLAMSSFAPVVLATGPLGLARVVPRRWCRPCGVARVSLTPRRRSWAEARVQSASSVAPRAWPKASRRGRAV